METKTSNIKEFMWHYNNEIFCDEEVLKKDSEATTFYPTQELKMGEKTVVYFQADSDGVNYVVVPGFKMSSIYKNENKVDMVKVMPVPLKKKKEISDILKTKAKGFINFW